MQIIDEQWREVTGTDGRYWVSSLGQVRGPRKLLRLVNEQGYLRVNVYGKRSGMRRVHCLVAAAFLGPCPDNCEVNHIDGNKQNNAVSNLEYATSKENKQHAWRHGLATHRGSNNVRAKLEESTVKKIREASKSGSSLRTLAAEYGVSPTQIRRIVVGRQWAHVA